ncbi:MAG: hypothetical protein WCQ64_01545 [Acidobacteriota bacterium]
MGSRLDRFRSAIGLVIAAALGTTALLDPAVAWFAIPAAIGGLGLIVMAAVIAAQYREIQYVLALGAIGGTTMAAWLIHHRRVQAPTPAPLQLLKTRR